MSMIAGDLSQVVSSVRINAGIGRPKTRPIEFLDDAAYDTDIDTVLSPEKRH
jgi:hypothetical protein